MYAIFKIVNGACSVQAEGIEAIEQAKSLYHGTCQTLWNSADVKNASVMIVDERLNVVDGNREYITHNNTIE